MIRQFFASLLVALGLVSGGVVCADQPPAGVTTTLFNGVNLDGWQVIGCQPRVENGLLVTGGADGWIRTNEKHGDFILELEWRSRKAKDFDAGVFVRAVEPGEGEVFPPRYQVNLKDDAIGHLLTVDGTTTPRDIAQPDVWNRYKITAIGDTLALEINGQQVWKVTGIEPAEGYIGLQSATETGGEFEFRNLRVTDLDYRSLFNGTDLSGWVGDTNGYAVENGAIVCLPSGGRLFTDDQFQDFSLRFDFKMEAEGNNGIGIRSPLEGNPAFVAMEIQILDDHSEKYEKMIEPYQAHGSVYGVVAAKRGFQKPPGEWNQEEILVRGHRVTVILNGVTIVDADVDEASANGTLDGKDHPGLKNERGHIGFLGHGARVEFKNLRIKPL